MSTSLFNSMPPSRLTCVSFAIQHYIFIALLIFQTSCGSGSSSSKITDLTATYEKLANNISCFEVGLNDKSEVLLDCQFDLTTTGSSGARKFYKFKNGGDYTEIPFSTDISDSESSYAWGFGNNGNFMLAAYAVITTNLDDDGSTGTSRNYLWNGKEYSLIDDYVINASDNGEFFSGISNTGGQILLKGNKRIELYDAQRSFRALYNPKVTNSGQIIGDGLQQNESSRTYIWSDKKLQEIAISSTNNRESYITVDVNNRRDVLFLVLPVEYDSESPASSTKYLIKNASGEEHYFSTPNMSATSINDKGVILLLSDEPFIYSQKSGLKKLSEIVSPPENYKFIYANSLNNNNELIVDAALINEESYSNKIFIVHLGDDF